MKTELKNPQHSSHTITLSKSTIFAKNTDFLQKNADISKIKWVLVLKIMFSETTYVCLFTYQISSFQHTFNSFRQGVILTPTAKRTPKKPTQIRVK